MASKDKKEFIVVNDFDEFEESTKTEHKDKLKWSSPEKGKYDSIQLYHIKSPKVDELRVNLHVESEDWVNLGQSKITFNCDKDNSHHNFEDCGKSNDHEKTWESAYFVMSKEELEQVCEAEKLKIRLTALNFNEEPNDSECEEFQKHCRQFYNNFFDESKYTDALKGGCFIATATMGSYNNPDVEKLRIFRDEYLLQRKWGRNFTRLYYKWGPYPANIIKQSRFLKRLSYYIIVKPLTFIATIITK